VIRVALCREGNPYPGICVCLHPGARGIVAFWRGENLIEPVVVNIHGLTVVDGAVANGPDEVIGHQHAQRDGRTTVAPAGTAALICAGPGGVLVLPLAKR
jgi:hypothetical protein